MESNNNNIIYKGEDLIRYVQGKMTSQQMHALEKAALEDSFLAEALEGYIKANLKSEKLQQFKDRIDTKREKKPHETKIVPVWKWKWLQYTVAASIILAGGWWLVSISNETKQKNKDIIVAQNETVAQSADSSKFSNATIPPSLAPLTDDFKPLSDRTISEQEKSKTKTITQNEPVIVEPSPYKKPLESERQSPISPPTQQEVGLIAPKQNIEAKDEEALKKDQLDGSLSTTDKPKAGLDDKKEAKKGTDDNMGNIVVKGNKEAIPSNRKLSEKESGVIRLTTQDYKGDSNANNEMNGMRLGRQKKQSKMKNVQPVMIEKDSTSSVEPSIGWNNYNIYLLNNNRISENAGGNHFVKLSFEVNDNGEVYNVSIDQSAGKEMDTEAIRLLKEGSKWKNAKKRAKVIFRF